MNGVRILREFSRDHIFPKGVKFLHTPTQDHCQLSGSVAELALIGPELQCT